MMKRIALVTAGHQGLGLGWTEYLVTQGYEVIIAGRSIDRMKIAANKFNREGDLVHPMQLDVSSEDSIAKLSDQVGERFGRLDLLVNNAGVNPKDFKDKDKVHAGFNLEFLEADVLIDVYKVNSIGPILMVKHFKKLLEEGEEKTVLNISSWLSSVTNVSFGGHYGYVSSKNLLNVLNKNMALEIKSSGIKCLNVNPGWVKTDMGGSKANFTPLESVEQVYSNVILKTSIEDSGKFFNYDGEIHPW